MKRKKRKSKMGTKVFTSNKQCTYVVHYCPRCNRCWVDKDLTHVKTLPPQWKLCKECCKELGIDFNKQKPDGKNKSENV